MPPPPLLVLGPVSGWGGRRYNCANTYANEENSIRDDEMAIKWYKRAASYCHAKAENVRCHVAVAAHRVLLLRLHARGTAPPGSGVGRGGANVGGKRQGV